MSIQTLVEKIKEKGNPTVAGLDARLEYIPQHISRTYTWQLVLISYQNDPGSRSHRKKQ